MSVGGRLTGGDGGVRDDRTQIDRFPPATKSGCCEEVEEIVAALVQRANEPDPTQPACDWKYSVIIRSTNNDVDNFSLQTLKPI